MDCLDAMPSTDFVFGMAGNKVLDRLGAPVQLFDEFDNAAGS